MKPEIKTLIENLEFHEHEEKHGLWSRKLEEKDAGNKAGVTAYVDFRRPEVAEKGRRFYTIESIDGVFDRDDQVNAIPVLAYFKQERDKILSTNTKTKEDQAKTDTRTPAAHENALAKIQEIELDPEAIIRYVCPNATFEEAMIFLQVCKHHGLNPFIPGEVFLIKFDKTQPAVIVVGKYTFTKKADKHPDFRGYHTGIIVLTKENTIEEREGTFYLPKGNDSKKEDVFEMLLGGWAKVKRNNREDIIERVSLHEAMKFNKDGRPTKAWREQPATMIRKVALVRALREAFPAELGGLYDKSEISTEVE